MKIDLIRRPPCQFVNFSGGSKCLQTKIILLKTEHFKRRTIFLIYFSVAHRKNIKRTWIADQSDYLLLIVQAITFSFH